MRRSRGTLQRAEVLAHEFAADTGAKTAPTAVPPLALDPRLLFLVNLLRDLDPEKVLLICRSKEKVEAIEATLRQHLSVKARSSTKASRRLRSARLVRGRGRSAPADLLGNRRVRAATSSSPTTL